MIPTPTNVGTTLYITCCIPYANSMCPGEKRHYFQKYDFLNTYTSMHGIILSYLAAYGLFGTYTFSYEAYFFYTCMDK